MLYRRITYFLGWKKYEHISTRREESSKEQGTEDAGDGEIVDGESFWKRWEWESISQQLAVDTAEMGGSKNENKCE